MVELEGIVVDTCDLCLLDSTSSVENMHLAIKNSFHGVHEMMAMSKATRVNNIKILVGLHRV